jgi:probable HAF family extracellular repeat protein
VGGNDSQATGIDSEHRVVGSAQTGEADPFFGQQFHPFLWEKGLMTDLGTFGGPDGFAAGINEVGQVVGAADVNGTPVPPLSIPPFFAFLWENSVMTNLGALGGIESGAFAVNNRSQVTGEFTFVDSEGNGITHTFLWEGGVMQDVGTIPGDQSSIPNAIDDKGRVVGASGSGVAPEFNFTPLHAFLWENGVMTDLNTRIPANAGFQLIFAFGINPGGQIVACGVEASGNIHAVLLTPAHEAGSLTGSAPAPENNAKQRPQVSPSENARRLLRLATPGLGRFRLGK